MIAEGDTLPDLELTLPDGGPVRLGNYAGAPFVLYFYPKDDTSGCTREAQEFSDRIEGFKGVGTAVLGVSKDSPARHRKFIAKYGLAVPLASDEEGKVIEAFGSWVEKSLYGRKYMGIDRSTFLFDRAGKLVRAWRKVKVPGHVDAVLEAVRALDD
jgi:peroxiredoxin Q/BCP